MSSQEPTAPRFSVDDIAAMSDAALAGFMEKNRRPHGAYELPVDDWDKLSKDERKILADRLIAQERVLAQSAAAHSCPLDLGQLDARLRQVSANDNNASVRAPPRIIETSRSPTPFIDQDVMSRERETDAYNDLVKYGGRPLYPIDLLDAVSRHPEEHEELLGPWRDNFGDTKRFWDDNNTAHVPWEVFQRQWSRWRYFRKWQVDNRWLEDDDGGFPAFIENRKERVRRHYTKRAVVKELARIEADPLCLKGAWDLKQLDRQRQRDYCREFHGGDEFSDYVDAVTRRLAQHGFTRPFQLKEDLKQQNQLATWIEYLNFEYWWLDRYTDTIERLKPGYAKAWQKLVDSKVLRPHETTEYLRSAASGNQQWNEEDRAWKAVQRATAKAEQVYTSTQLDPHRLMIPQLERIRRIDAARRELVAAQGLLESIKRRNNLIGDFASETAPLALAKKDAARHRILLPWILEQVSMVEAELNKTEAMDAGGPIRTNRIKRTKRLLDSDDGNLRQRGPKKQKLGQLDSGLSTEKGTAFSAEGKQIHEQVLSPLVIEADSPPQDEGRRQGAREISAKPSPQSLAVQGLRRSARIAEAAAAAAAMAAATDRPNSCSSASNCPNRSRPSNRRKPVQSLRYLSTTENAKPRAAMKKYSAGSSSRRDSSKPQGISQKGWRRSQRYQ